MKKNPESEKVTWYVSILLKFLMEDCVEVVGHPAAFARDVETVTRRTAAEGETFLMKTLSEFGRSIDAALTETSPLSSKAFKRRSKKSSLPSFLSGLTCLVFRDDGTVMDTPSIPAIRLIRQICGWFKKMERGYSEESLQQAVIGLIETDRCLPSLGDFDKRRDLEVARALIGALFAGFSVEKLRPRHGKGAVAGGETATQKRRIRPRFKQLNRWFPPIPWFASLRDVSEDYGRVTNVISGDYGLSRLAFVNKDYRGPRVISLEPAEYQWVQQSLMRWMYSRVERYRLTRGHVNFTDQMVNRDLALSLDWDTLDMSEASDRNSLAIVEFLFRSTRILPYLLASRTPGTLLPSGEILWFKKFAPMGSATCFAVQASVYWALAVQALVGVGFPLGLALRKVYVYGDDIIVPHGHFDAINALFSSVGMKFNREKSCISGKFRESCGVDAYDGHDVTPIRLKHSERGPELSAFVPLIEHANLLEQRGYRAASRELRHRIQEKCPVYIPLHNEPLPIQAFVGKDFPSTIKSRVVDSIPQVLGWTVESSKIEDSRGAADRYYLRESLSLGGPVGTLDVLNGDSRWLTRKYSVLMRKQWLTYHSAEYPSLTDDELKRLVKPVEPNWYGRSCSLPNVSHS